MDLFDTDHGANSLNNSWLCSQSNQAPGCRYEDELFLERVLSTIEAHDPSQPFFLFWAPHIVHGSFLKPPICVDLNDPLLLTFSLFLTDPLLLTFSLFLTDPLPNHCPPSSTPLTTSFPFSSPVTSSTVLS